jgi:outer membrane scaffolding protein for murein synthesis (MipA/OmpV family)
MPMRQILIPSFMAACLLVSAARAADLPRWELGLGLAGLTIPDYRGSDQQRGYLLPLPYVQYRGEVFQIDREGAHGKLLAVGRARLELSVVVGQPARNNDNQARRDMPDINPTVEIGPSLEIYLVRDVARQRAWLVQLPWRAVAATDLSHVEGIGWVFAPSLNYETWNNGGWGMGIAAGPLYASEKYHDYYYEVLPVFATATRPAYDASGGYSGSRLTFTTSRRFPGFWIGAFARYDRLSGAAFEDSPLVKQKSSFMAGVGIAWVLAEAKK